MYHIYIDAEFDAVKINRKFYQMVISLGAVMVDEDGKKLDEFYTLVRPYGFSRLTNIVKKITHMSNEMILSAENLNVAEKNFKKWVYAYSADMEELRLYSFGPDDRRTIVQNCTSLKLDKEGLFNKIIDLQRVISPSVKFQEKSISPTLSLDDLKSVFGIEGAVDHNALSDARDLMRVHQAYLQGDVAREEKIVEIVNRKVAKQLEVQMKQRKRLSQLMKERFHKFKQLDVNVVFYPEVIEQLQLWEDRDPNSILHWKKDEFIYHNKSYTYDKISMRMRIDIENEIPSVTLSFTIEGETFEKRFLLQYRNATMIETIVKRLQ